MSKELELKQLKAEIFMLNTKNEELRNDNANLLESTTENELKLKQEKNGLIEKIENLVI
jgi:hypothetical protein